MAVSEPGEATVDKRIALSSPVAGSSVGRTRSAGGTPKMQFKANASIPKNMPVGCAAASASPVGDFHAGGQAVLNLSEDRMGRYIVRYYRKRRRHRNRLETEARMAA